MNCKYILKKLNGQVWCEKYKCKITNQCRLCELKEFADKELKEMKKQTSKKRKAERNRYSLFVDNLKKCYLCPSTYEVHPHEIFAGRNRQNSIKYDLIIPLCNGCHSKYQNDAKFNHEWHIKGQKMFNKKYPELDFLDIFKINYL